jgi:organic radical activating enzyme
MIQEWELVNYCNYNCEYCILFENNVQTDEEILKKFMDSLNKDINLLCLGGEPFLHPKIEFIINYLNKIKQPFTFQTNASTKSLQIIEKLNINCIIDLQISIHPTQITKKDLIKNIKKLRKINNIRVKKIDIMCTEDAIDYYKLLTKFFKCTIVPISGFYEKDKEINCKYTTLFIKYKNKYIDINFEHYIVPEYNLPREIVWQKQCSGEINNIGKKCNYQYSLYDSNLNKFNCCFKKNSSGICENSGCFWM